MYLNYLTGGGREEKDLLSSLPWSFLAGKRRSVKGGERSERIKLCREFWLTSSEKKKKQTLKKTKEDNPLKPIPLY